jgi:hypothetical protein
MKAIIKAMLFIVTLALLCRCDNSDPDPNINIPDNNFLNALIELGVDTNGDYIISVAEAEAVTSMDVSDWSGERSISDMTGIEAFVNLDTLDCSWNLSTTLDVSNNTALTTLYCFRNQLTTLDVSNNTNLTDLHLNRMPTLYEVCVWETFFLSPDDYYLDTTGSPNIYFTLDCN